MAGRNEVFYTNGTSALKMPRWVEEPEDAKIIMFPTSRTMSLAEGVPQDDDQPSADRQGAFRTILDSSEMMCSLRLESMAGCPYNLFTKRGIAALSIGSAIVGVASAILGS